MKQVAPEVVLIHGLGVGITPYLRFIREALRVNLNGAQQGSKHVKTSHLLVIRVSQRHQSGPAEIGGPRYAWKVS